MVNKNHLEIFKLRTRLWLTHYNYVRTVNNGTCIDPVKVYTYSLQVIYNKWKDGLDKSCECEQRVQSEDKLMFKHKYIVQMIDANISNYWRNEQSHSILLQYTIKLNKNYEEISIKNCAGSYMPPSE